MGRSLNRSMTPTPTVNLRDKVGSFFTGILKGGPRIVRMKRGSGKVYDFAILDTDMPIQMKKDKEYVEAQVSEGDMVCLFAPTALANMLDGAKVGEKVHMIYRGKMLTKTGTEFHAFDAEVID